MPSRRRSPDKKGAGPSPRIFLSPPWVGREERLAVERAFDSGYVAPCGPMVDEFERRIAALAGRKFAVAVSSGTAALDLVMAELGVDSSWTVIAPTLTFIATVGPAWHRGAKPVFVDCDERGCVDLALLGKALADARRERRGAKGGGILFVGVDLYGRCCDHGAIAGLCRKHGAVFVNDAAEAVGATWNGHPSGSAGFASVYSFNGNKIFTTSGGGALLTDDPGVAERARRRSQQSREPFPWYQHAEVGYNYRMSNILASVGLAQLSKLPRILKARARNRAFYAARCRTLAPVEGENNWLTVALLDSSAERDALLARLAAENVESRHVWKPLHLQPVFAGCRTYGGAVAELLFERGLCLPSGTGLTAADRRRVAACLCGATGATR
jgi:dTDP-4-amino-4,6-dideoxygalactose transaminase